MQDALIQAVVNSAKDNGGHDLLVDDTYHLVGFSDVDPHMVASD